MHVYVMICREKEQQREILWEVDLDGLTIKTKDGSSKPYTFGKQGLFSSCHISTICRICFESSQQLLCIKFEFFIPDRVFKLCENTDHVYAAIAAPIVEGAMEGFNG